MGGWLVPSRDCVFVLLPRMHRAEMLLPNDDDPGIAAVVEVP